MTLRYPTCIGPRNDLGPILNHHSGGLPVWKNDRNHKVALCVGWGYPALFQTRGMRGPDFALDCHNRDLCQFKEIPCGSYLENAANQLNSYLIATSHIDSIDEGTISPLLLCMGRQVKVGGVLVGASRTLKVYHTDHGRLVECRTGLAMLARVSVCGSNKLRIRYSTGQRLAATKPRLESVAAGW
jgi:hypothetical protein